MSLFLKFRAAACSAALLAASCTTPSTGGTAEPLSLEAATEAMFADALERPAAASAAFDAEKLKAFAGDSAAITWSAAGPDKASGAYKLSDVRMEILGETPYTFLTANEVLLWNADLGAVEDRLAGKRLGETLKLFDRIEMSGVEFDLSDYMNAVESAAAEALPDSDVALVAYDGSTMKVDRVIFGAMTLHPWTFAPNEDGDDGVEAIRLISALLRSILERRQELAMMLAMGFRGNSLARMLVLENAGLLALGLAWGMACALLAVGPALAASGARVPWAGLLGMLAGMAALGLASCVLAARAAVGDKLVTALREG